MKKILFFCLFVFFISEVFETHIIGGEMRYEYKGAGTFPNTKKYVIHLLLLKDNASGAALPSQCTVGIYNNEYKKLQIFY